MTCTQFYLLSPLSLCFCFQSLFFFSLFLPHSLLLFPSNNHPSCPQFPLLSFPTFSLCSFFCRHDSFLLYLLSFIFFCHLRLPPTLPHCLMREEDLGVRIVRSLNSSPRPSPGNAVSVLFLFFKIVFTSFHFLICFHHSVITVFCQPVINGPAERFRLSACGCVYAGVHVCIYARQCVREEMHGHSDPIIVIRFDLYEGKTTAELHLDFQIKRCYTSIRVCKKPMGEKA